MSFELNEQTFMMYAIKNYDNPHCCGITEFFDDLKRFKYIKRLFRKAKRTADLKERLILNHLVVIYNLFGPDAATRMLFYKIDPEDWVQLKTFLVFLNYMPERIVLANGTSLPAADIALDQNIIDTLRNI
ncbi:MAG: hypothetical protein EB010_10970 [Acidimicrobiia bacterium]|jgi:hypothetical protein|nr:hypothetical protein [Actinomycetota bacterium]NDE59917.1 hypothetical protein [Acidimicrobiia bacterium]NDE81343.1 hypothetical protein [Actinomycetota bacterium]